MRVLKLIIFLLLFNSKNTCAYTCILIFFVIKKVRHYQIIFILEIN